MSPDDLNLRFAGEIVKVAVGGKYLLISINLPFKIAVTKNLS